MRTSAVLFLATLLMPAAIRGQEKGADLAVYRVEFNIHDGSTSRRYVMMIEGNDKGVMKLGQKVPYATGSFHPTSATDGASPLVATQFNYAEVGVNIDCRLNELNGKVQMKASLEISTVLPHDKSTQQIIPSPTIGQLRMDVNGVLNLGKPTMVASIDDPVTLRKFDVETTVTKMN
jgi:hypothetical protein